MTQEIALRIADVQIDIQKKLTSDEKQNFAKIISGAFERQKTLYSREFQIKKDKLIDAYKKEVKADKLVLELKKAQEKVEMCRKALWSKGLTDFGNVQTQGTAESCGKDAEEAYKDLLRMLDELNSKPADDMQAKLLARLWLCSTYGEVAVILREVLGNGVLPTITTLESRSE